MVTEITFVSSVQIPMVLHLESSVIFGDEFIVTDIDDSEPGQALVGDISNVVSISRDYL